MRRTLTILALLTVVEAGVPWPCSATLVFDDFERHTLGANWVVLAGSGSIGILDQSDLGLQVGPARGGAVEWGADAFGVDEFSEAQLSPERIDSMLTQVFIRHRSFDNARYGFHWNNGFGGRWEIKYDGVPTAQTRILASILAPEPQPADRIRIEARGARISGYHNGTLILSAEDTATDAITTAGGVGVVFRFTTTYAAIYPSSVFEEWSGGDLSTTTSVASRNPPVQPLSVTFRPNPVVGTSIIDFSGQNAEVEVVKLEISDASGRWVQSREVGGARAFRLDRIGMAPGVYFYRVLASDRLLARGRFVVE